MAYELKLHRDIEKQLQRIPKNQRGRLVETMRSLREDPRPPGGEKLAEVLYSVRAGQYRIIHEVFDEDQVVVICKVARQTDGTYRDLHMLLDRANRFIQG